MVVKWKVILKEYFSAIPQRILGKVNGHREARKELSVQFIVEALWYPWKKSTERFVCYQKWEKYFLSIFTETENYFIGWKSHIFYCGFLWNNSFYRSNIPSIVTTCFNVRKVLSTIKNIRDFQGQCPLQDLFFKGISFLVVRARISILVTIKYLENIDLGPSQVRVDSIVFGAFWFTR